MCQECEVELSLNEPFRLDLRGGSCPFPGLRPGLTETAPQAQMPIIAKLGSWGCSWRTRHNRWWTRLAIPCAFTDLLIAGSLRCQPSIAVVSGAFVTSMSIEPSPS